MTKPTQSQLRDFISREVIYCVSTLIYELSRDEKHLDDILEISSRHREDVAECPHCGHRAQRDEWEETTIGSGDDEIAAFACPKCDKGTPEDDLTFEDEDLEAYEHWLVTGWLAEKLEERGEIVGEFLGLTIWGRTCTGQAIYMDGVIEEIYVDLHKS